jgi:hypothetical protein
MTTQSQPQTALDEREINNAELESVLEDREVAKGKAGETRKKYTTVDEVAKDKIAALKLAEGDVVRIGRFRIKLTNIPARDVAFETSATSRLSISPVGDDD